MQKSEISASEAARNLSEVLSLVKFHGMRYTILRGGKPVAVIGPVEGTPARCTLGDFKALMRRAPRLGDEAATFEADIAQLPVSLPQAGAEGWD
ncbi:MAG: type II toxin-antitoxin system Phd/YefM family antitoxin [Candidatus Eremiobacterota bacterium]